LKPNREWIERAQQNTSPALRYAWRVESDWWRSGLDQFPAGAGTCMSLDFRTDSGRRSAGGVLSGRIGLGLITDEMRPGIPVGTPVKLTAYSDAGRFSLLHRPPMHLQYPCGVGAGRLNQLVAVTRFLPSMPSA